MPRPPPPADASSSTGTPAAAISFLDSILEPIARTASTGGPTQVRPASCTAAANSAFSERNP
ncbi:Uncharacterised protein [Mycobacterium tuberculosis]|nr:Uncharacterised protein [Mycobacterium tuberculosis]